MCSLVQVTHTLEGMLEHFSGSHLHLVVVTDRGTRDMVGQHIARILTRLVGHGGTTNIQDRPPCSLATNPTLPPYYTPLPRWVSTGAIQATSWRWRRQRGLPHLHLSLVDIEAVIEEDRMFINNAKMITSETLRSSESK